MLWITLDKDCTQRPALVTEVLSLLEFPSREAVELLHCTLAWRFDVSIRICPLRYSLHANSSPAIITTYVEVNGITNFCTRIFLVKFEVFTAMTMKNNISSQRALVATYC
jgi:hypothetical protein